MKTTEEILKEQIKELQELIRLKDLRIAELSRLGTISTPFVKPEEMITNIKINPITGLPGMATSIKEVRYYYPKKDVDGK